MPKKIKVFESGEFPQGTFTKNDVTQIFSRENLESKAQFIHTSKWGNKSPLELGKLSNFSIEDVGDKLEVYGDLELNEVGNEFKGYGFLSGLSVEINPVTKELKRTAILPIGIPQQIEGATLDFEKLDKENVVFISHLEFEETETDILNKILTLPFENQMKIFAGIKNSISAEDKQTLRNLIYEYGLIEKKEGDDKQMPEPNKTYTEAEFQAELQKAKFEEAEKMQKENQARLEFEMKKIQVQEIVKKKFVPADQAIVEYALLAAAKDKDNLVEFEANGVKGKIPIYEEFMKKIVARQDLSYGTSIVESLEMPTVTEFGKQGEKPENYVSAVDRFAAYGGGK